MAIGKDGNGCGLCPLVEKMIKFYDEESQFNWTVKKCHLKRKSTQIKANDLFFFDMDTRDSHRYSVQSPSKSISKA